MIKCAKCGYSQNADTALSCGMCYANLKGKGKPDPAPAAAAPPKPAPTKPAPVAVAPVSAPTPAPAVRRPGPAAAVTPAGAAPAMQRQYETLHGKLVGIVDKLSEAYEKNAGLFGALTAA